MTTDQQSDAKPTSKQAVLVVDPDPQPSAMLSSIMAEAGKAC